MAMIPLTTAAVALSLTARSPTPVAMSRAQSIPATTAPHTTPLASPPNTSAGVLQVTTQVKSAAKKTFRGSLSGPLFP